MPPSCDRLLTDFALCYWHMFHHIFDMLHLPDITWLDFNTQRGVDFTTDLGRSALILIIKCAALCKLPGSAQKGGELYLECHGSLGQVTFASGEG